MHNLSNIIWLAVVVVVCLVLVHVIALKLLSRHFRRKYPETFKQAEEKRLKAYSEGSSKHEADR